RRAQKTLSKYDKVLERLLELAEQRRVRTVQGVNLAFVDAYRSKRVEAPVAAKTLYTETVLIRQLVNFALARGWVAADPLKGLRLKKPKPNPQPCWTPDEVGKIIESATERERPKF